METPDKLRSALTYFLRITSFSYKFQTFGTGIIFALKISLLSPFNSPAVQVLTDILKTHGLKSDQ
jgi:hypothetical protein